MAKYGGIIYCNKAARKWEKEASEGCIVFVVCPEDNNVLSFSTPTPTIDDEKLIKPRPYVNGKVVDHEKLAAYPYSQLKEFVHFIDWKSDWGTGVSGDAPKPKEKESKESTPSRTRSMSTQKKEEKERSDPLLATAPSSSSKRRDSTAKEGSETPSSKRKEKKPEDDEGKEAKTPSSTRKKESKDKDKKEGDVKEKKDKEDKDAKVTDSPSSSRKKEKKDEAEEGKPVERSSSSSRPTRSSSTSSKSKDPSTPSKEEKPKDEKTKEKTEETPVAKSPSVSRSKTSKEDSSSSSPKPSRSVKGDDTDKKKIVVTTKEGKTEKESVKKALFKDEDEVDAGPRKIKVDLNKVDSEVKASDKTVMADPLLDTLTLDSASVGFLHESYEPPNKYLSFFREVELSKPELLALEMADEEAMKKGVAGFKGPKNKMSASPFTERGLDQYFGEEDAGVLVMAPPHVSLQGLMDDDEADVNFLGSIKNPPAPFTMPSPAPSRASEPASTPVKTFSSSTSTEKQTATPVASSPSVPREKKEPKELPKTPKDLPKPPRRESSASATASPAPAAAPAPTASPAASPSEPLIWTDSKGTIGLTKRFWYQLIGKADDGAISADTRAFYANLTRMTGTKVDVDSPDRPTVAQIAINAMDKENPFDIRLKTRLLEQAGQAKVIQ